MANLLKRVFSPAVRKAAEALEHALALSDYTQQAKMSAEEGLNTQKAINDTIKRYAAQLKGIGLMTPEEVSTEIQACLDQMRLERAKSLKAKREAWERRQEERAALKRDYPELAQI
ncbi:hypothetical protein [Phyllobacterium myrsinacearum]|uniref:Uncharacterized protein n=1 Tax=Phyllobacterium myrsinacearum TaxID=28101 RepID=A0A839EU29_9HYPH|nr:hypothetical protein [Phyllobacterium myrsinacearum]MBA8881688.1 hypothetical protein [Phyllobacterium myrsinacearum]